MSDGSVAPLATPESSRRWRTHVTTGARMTPAFRPIPRSPGYKPAPAADWDSDSDSESNSDGAAGTIRPNRVSFPRRECDLI